MGAHAPRIWCCGMPPQEVRSWLEGIIERSKERAGVHSHRVQVGARAAGEVTPAPTHFLP